MPLILDTAVPVNIEQHVIPGDRVTRCIGFMLGWSRTMTHARQSFGVWTRRLVGIWAFSSVDGLE